MSFKTDSPGGPSKMALAWASPGTSRTVTDEAFVALGSGPEAQPATAKPKAPATTTQRLYVDLDIYFDAVRVLSPRRGNGRPESLQ